MSEKRKDSKGRILRTGESQRKDGTYMYRFVDFRKIRRCVYAATLDELRAKETKIQKDIGNGIDYAGGEITVIELVKRYIGQKPTASIKTKDGYNFVLNLLERDELCYRQIKTVKPSDGKAFFIRMYDKGMQYNTIEKVRSVIKPAFTMAVDDDILRKNPFSFPLSCIVQNSTVKREALREEDIEKFLAYVMNDTCSCRYYDEVVILLGTGLRASELCGLTKDDIDFSRRRICVEKQLLQDSHGTYYVSKPKTSNGIRYIPMDKNVCSALRNVMLNRKRPKVERMIDGYTGFLFLDRNGNPKTVRHLDNVFRSIVKRYNMTHAEKLLVTPHILQHTFCTRLINADMDPKSVQYILGHGDLNITLGTYAHSSYETAEKAFMKMLADG